MRVLNLMLSSGVGGLEAVAYQYARVLAEGDNVSAMVVNKKSPYATPQSVQTFYVQGASLANPFNHLAVARAVRTFCPDVILGHGSRGADFCKSPVVRFAAPQGTRYIGVLHGENARHFHGLDHVIVVSEGLREFAVMKGGLASSLMSVCPNAVEVPENPPPEPSGAVPVIGFLGRFDICKGLDVLLEACAQMKRDGCAFRLDIGGAGPERPDLERRARALGIADEVRWLGWVSDKRRFFANINVLAMPSREEAVGLVMLEAMAHCRAVILTDCPGPVGIAADVGVIVPRGDVSALAEGLRNLLCDVTLRQNLALRSRQRVESSYSPVVLSRRLESVLQNLPRRSRLT